MNPLIKSTVCMLLLSACSTLQPAYHPKLSYQDVKNIPVRTSIGEVEKKFGRPDERSLNSSGDTEFSYLNQPDGYQVAFLSFDKGGALYAKGYVVRNEDPQENLSALLKTEFANLKFDSVEKPRCGLDIIFPPYLVNRSNGLVIESFSSGSVALISWYRSDRLDGILKMMTECHSKEK